MFSNFQNSCIPIHLSKLLKYLSLSVAFFPKDFQQGRLTGLVQFWKQTKWTTQSISIKNNIVWIFFFIWCRLRGLQIKPDEDPSDRQKYNFTNVGGQVILTIKNLSRSDDGWYVLEGNAGPSMSSITLDLVLKCKLTPKRLVWVY